MVEPGVCARRINFSLSLILIFLFTCSWYCGSSTEGPAPTPLASDAIPPGRMQQYSDLAVEWMQQYLRVDTTNPPGNEMRAAQFLKKILDQEGIENQVFEYQPGRADLWAVLPHSTGPAKRPIVFLNHMDVVTSDASHWKVPPF